MKQTWTPEEVWAAAACAHRINGGYYKDDEYTEGQKTRIKNFTLAKSALEDVSQIPEIDFEKGRAVRTWLEQRLTMKALKGHLKEFDNLMTRVIGFEKFSDLNRYEIAVVTSQIHSYEESIEALAWQDQIDRSLGHLAPIGEKAEVDVLLTNAKWSVNFAVYFYQGITPTKQGVWFSTKHRLTKGAEVRIRGTVKHHRDFSTQLNRVKIIKGEIA